MVYPDEVGRWTPVRSTAPKPSSGVRLGETVLQESDSGVGKTAPVFGSDSAGAARVAGQPVEMAPPTQGAGSFKQLVEAEKRINAQQQAAHVPNSGPNLNTLEGVTSEINRNADIAVELTRRALERGRITDSAQAFGTRTHKLFEGLNNRLERRLGDRGSPFSIISEEFRDAAGDVTSRRARGSIGADVKILDVDNPDFIQILDLKTHGGNEIQISPYRQQQFIDRFDAPAEEIFRQR